MALPLLPGSHFVPDIVGDRRRGFAGAEGLLSVGCGQRRTPAGQVLGGMVTSMPAVLVVLGGGQVGVDGGRGVGQRGQPGQVGTQPTDIGRDVVPAATACSRSSG